MEEDVIQFEYPEKAILNIRKHRVSFREAAMVFNDTLAITYYDDAHSHHEPRFVTLGISDKARVLVVCHTWIGENIRLISARKATRHETNFYEKENEKTRRRR